MESNSIQNLLQQVSAKRKHYDIIAEATGENFNIFKILKLQTKEVRLHSALLAELLNPKGSHGQKDIFLKLFVQLIKINDFDTSNASVEVEKHAGWINEDCTEGGYIDLVITSSRNQRIIIENKIYAGDQENQLFRYHQYDKNAHLFYLSLDGRSPTDWSANGLEKDKHYKVISYKSVIYNWLENCKKESINHPLLRETITQYINLIKSLTGQSTNNMMNQEIKEKILASYESYKSAELIAGTFAFLKDDIKRLFHQTINQKRGNTFPKINISDEIEIDFEISADEDGVYYGFTPTLKSNPNTNCAALPELQKYSQILKEIDANTLNNQTYIGWKYPKNWCNLDEVPMHEDVYKLSDEEYRNKYVDELLKEATEYYNKFKEKAYKLFVSQENNLNLKP